MTKEEKIKKFEEWALQMRDKIRNTTAEVEKSIEGAKELRAEVIQFKKDLKENKYEDFKRE